MLLLTAPDVNEVTVASEDVNEMPHAVFANGIGRVGTSATDIEHDGQRRCCGRRHAFLPEQNRILHLAEKRNKIKGVNAGDH